MRVLLAGFLLLFLTTSAFAQAEADGYVESMGYGGRYRPNCWTPMKLHMQSKIADAKTYKIAIVQEDLDRDRVLYTRPFTLNGNPPGGGGKAEEVWVYFMPQPRDLRIVGGAAEFSSLIRIFLCREDGKQLLQIPFQPGSGSLPRDIDQKMTLYGGKQHATRLVLVVGGSDSKPISTYDKPEGLVEDVEFYKLTPSELPGDVKGFAAVDAIVWLGSDPDLRADSLAAIQDYVRDGGKLVVCQGKNWQKFKESELAALLPVTLDGVAKEKGAESLRLLAGMPMFEKLDDEALGKLRTPWVRKKLDSEKLLPFDPWYSLVGKELEIIKATPKNGAFVNLYCESDKSMPYLARWVYGVGTVVWVAQDFGDKDLLPGGLDRYMGWQSVWDRTFDWRNDTIVSMMPEPPLIYKNFTSNVPDLGRTILTGMELPRRGAALVALAMVLFIGYWLVAGPGSYFFLLARRKAYFSWVAFAVCALGATALTAAVVKLVLRGPPQLQHVTFVHMAPDHETVAQSQLGLYIPRDGKQHIELTDFAPKRFSYIIPYPIHPDHLIDSADYPAYKEFEIPMRDRLSAEPPAIDVPYRSTLKKFQARWIGQLAGGIDGKATLSADTNGVMRLSGTLVNNTGHDLRSVYLVYTRTAELPSVNADDELIELTDPLDGRASWGNGVSLDLADIYSKLGIKGMERKPGNVGWRERLNGVWMESWSDKFTSSMIPGGGGFDDKDRAALLMTIYDRLKVGKIKEGNGRQDRYELLRPGGRQFDASGAVSAGQLLVFAKAEDAALPFGLKVEGEAVKGEGVVYYQVIVPLTRAPDALQPMRGETSIWDLANAPAVEMIPDRPQQPRQGVRSSPRPPRR